MWVHEGFCTYAEVLYVECIYGYSTMLDFVNNQKNRIKNDKPIIGHYHVNKKGSGDMYSKGALLLHTLRNLINNDLLGFNIMKGISNKSDREKLTKSLLSQTNLWKYRNRKLGTFSGGMKQRFGIAQALIGDPKLIIVDEPTAGLDPTERNRFHNLLSEIGENVIVILSTHIVEDVSDLCGNMAIIKDGQVKVVGEPQALIKELTTQVWTGLVEKKDFKSIKKNHQVISSRLSMGKVQIRVLDDNEPIAGFSQTSPEIEDLYFATINELDLKGKV